jgi:hypothetical protein
MKKLLFILLAITLVGCTERKIDPRETIILEFLKELKAEEFSAKLLYSNYFKENKFDNEVITTNYLHILSHIKEQLDNSKDFKVMTYAEAQSRSIEVPTINNATTDNVFVIEINGRYAFCVMNNNKIETLLPLWR